jgi:hypothetical protein
MTFWLTHPVKREILTNKFCVMCTIQKGPNKDQRANRRFDFEKE